MISRRIDIFTACAVTLAGVACGPKPLPLPAISAADGGASLTDLVGVSANLDWNDASHRAAQLQRLQSVGVARVRMDMNWHRLEQDAGVFDFTALDAVVGDAKAAGIDLLGIAAYGNPIYPASSTRADAGTNLPLDANPAIFYPPQDKSLYARFVATTAAHYAGTVRDYELWNEENIGYRFWRPTYDAAEYATLARAGAEAGRAACVGCRFVLGGVSMPQPVPQLELYPVGNVYLSQVLAADATLLSTVDAVAFHPYQYPKDPPEKETAPFPSRRQGSLATQTRAVAHAIDATPRPLWVTENGWPTNPGIPAGDAEIAATFGISTDVVALGRDLLGPDDFATLLETVRGVSEADQARYLVRSTLIAASLGLQRYFIYTLDDFDAHPEINQEAAFGLFRVDGSEKPAATALRALLARHGDLRFAADLAPGWQLDASDRALAFTGDSGATAVALWRWSGDTGELTVGPLPRAATLTDSTGAAIRTARKGDSIRMPLGADVVWLELAP